VKTRASCELGATHLASIESRRNPPGTLLLPWFPTQESRFVEWRAVLVLTASGLVRGSPVISKAGALQLTHTAPIMNNVSVPGK